MFSFVSAIWHLSPHLIGSTLFVFVRCSPKTFSAPVIPVSNFTTTPQVSETTDLVPVHRVDNQPVNEVSPVRSKIQKRRCVQNGKVEKIICNIPITFMLYVSRYESPASRKRSSRVRKRPAGYVPPTVSPKRKRSTPKKQIKKVPSPGSMRT